MKESLIPRSSCIRAFHSSSPLNEHTDDPGSLGYALPKLFPSQSLLKKKKTTLKHKTAWEVLALMGTAMQYGWNESPLQSFRGRQGG